MCDLCLAGAGGECHVPGCAFWLNRAPDLPIIVGDPGELERVTALAVRFETALHRISASIAGSVADLQEEAIEALNVKAADHA
jgi:hypothetical protein